MKDYYDLCIISRIFEFDYPLLKEAFLGTMKRRETTVPDEKPVALSEEFYSNSMKDVQWNAFIKKAKPMENVGTLADVVNEIKPFIMPLFDDSFDAKRWIPGKGWIQ